MRAPAETIPTPNSRAISIASSMPLVATTKPKASWPSSEPAIGVTRFTARLGRGLISFLRTRSR